MALPRSLPERLSRIHSWAHAQPWLGRFTLMNRLLLAMAFIPTGLVKASGQRFTSLPVSDPVGFFFEAMYQTGPFWVFIGASQMVASLLLLIPSTATLGAVLFLPIVFSIVLITWGIGFSGTVWVTSGMLVSTVYLLAWDADRLWLAASLLLGSRRGPSVFTGMNWTERIGWFVGGLVGVGFLLTARDILPSSIRPELLYVGLGGMGLVITGWIVSLTRSRGGGR
jgi:hypothetical protein